MTRSATRRMRSRVTRGSCLVRNRLPSHTLSLHALAALFQSGPDRGTRRPIMMGAVGTTLAADLPGARRADGELRARSFRGLQAAHRHQFRHSFARGAPQVMVKVTGGGPGMKAIAAHFRYISKNGRPEIDDERGQTIRGKDALREMTEEWRYGGNLIADSSPPAGGLRHHAVDAARHRPCQRAAGGTRVRQVQSRSTIWRTKAMRR